jgi:hypothetical protein
MSKGMYYCCNKTKRFFGCTTCFKVPCSLRSLFEIPISIGSGPKKQGVTDEKDQVLSSDYYVFEVWCEAYEPIKNGIIILWIISK